MGNMRYLSAFFLLFSFSFFLKAAPSRIDKLEGDVSELQSSFDHIELRMEMLNEKQSILDTNVNTLNSVIQASNSSINNSLDASSRFLTVVSIILALLALLLSWYVNRMASKIEKVEMKVNESLLKVTELSGQVSTKEEDVKKLVDEVNNNIEKLYARIRREDTKSLLVRLVEVPEDIDNIINLLFARDLEAEDYDVLKQAYQKCVDNMPKDSDSDGFIYGNTSDGYVALFFQHFLGRSIEDDLLRDRICDFMNEGLSTAFRNDLNNEIDSLGDTLSKTNLSFDRVEVLSKFINALKTSSNTKDNPEYLDRLRKRINDGFLWEQAEKNNGDSKDQPAKEGQGEAIDFTE